MDNAELHSSTEPVWWQGTLAMLFAAVLVLVLLQVDQREQVSWAVPEHDLVLAGTNYRVPAQQIYWLQEFSTLYFSGQETEARVLLEQESSRQIAQVFDSAEARLPAFADWYYSLGGEYTRLSMAVLSRLNLTDRNYPAEQAAAILFPDGQWESEMARAQQQLGQVLLQNQQRVHAEWLAQLSARLAPYRVPAPLEQSEANAPVALDALLGDTLIRQEQQALQIRSTLSTVAAMGVAGRTLWRTMGARSAAAAGRAAAGRGAARAGSAALGAGAVCAPTGPVALGCAAVAGAATWLASDWLLLNLDEHFNRDELIASMEEGLLELEIQTQREVEIAYDRLVAGWYAEIAEEIQTDFVPGQVLHNP